MNLIICCTPLQVLIAEKIIDKFPEQRFYGVMLTTVENPKMAFYRERLAKKCAGFFSMLQQKDRINLIKGILNIQKHFKGKQFERVFLANTHELQIQFLVSAVEFEQLNTFDDGTVNIIPNSPLYYDDVMTLKRRFINRLLGNKYSIKKLREASHLHYSIYKDMKNIIDNVEYIDLITDVDNSLSLTSTEKSISILLGQPIYPEDERNIALANKVIERFDIQYYLPHPREKYSLKNVEYINTHLIFEDYIFQQSQQAKYKVYTYFSSAIINVMNKSPNVEVVALEIDTENPSFQACYDLFRQMSIPVIDIRDN